MPLTEAERAQLANDVRAAIARTAPQWTDHNSSDPGITLLQALVYALEDLRGRSEPFDAEARALAARIAACAGELACDDSERGATAR
jgi:hypothetical protein